MDSKFVGMWAVSGNFGKTDTSTLNSFYGEIISAVPIYDSGNSVLSLLDERTNNLVNFSITHAGVVYFRSREDLISYLKGSE